METKLKEEDLERVSGIARYHERMWIERDKDGNIKQVYDLDLNPIEKKMLYLSFESVTQDDGFTYKGEFIKFPDIREYARKRAHGYQRRNYGHSSDKGL